ncbi:Ubiquitin carboxyl-terminal hydrolase 10 [Vitis vinifera]|uniref:Ubiquitin carboxyl-terminal hydrolase n=1 Tax=Vitis vinifera TaxID=29760 RepID=A0A438I4K2_VITVI|nr:Ubiquitin carboxyl-terminal hydrolase 10 [Vitis vinifera]
MFKPLRLCCEILDYPTLLDYVFQLQTFMGNGEYPINGHLSDSQRLDAVPSKTAERPGPIDNSDIVLNGNECELDDLEILRTLEEGRDYVLVPQEVWEKLFDWVEWLALRCALLFYVTNMYTALSRLLVQLGESQIISLSCKLSLYLIHLSVPSLRYKGGPALPRKMISQGITHKKFMVEIYRLCLKLTDSRDNSQSVIRLSKKASVHELYERVCTLKVVEQEKARIWDYFNKRKQAILVASNQTLEESNLQMDQDILLEVQLDGYWPSGFGMDSTGNELALGSPLGSTFTDMEDGYDVLRSVAKGDRGGLAGLQNLGNTCFMNSAIQCLVHTPPIFEYFLQDYTEEINKQNPLGMNGELAFAFGELLRKLWSSGRTPVAPRAFKGKLARFAPQFSGYNQHDSQELLAFLLDGLHEDLNRVKQKPYIETKDSNGRPDEEVADECWRNHKARNDSLIVDVCQGQYKSTLVCPVCSKISITFDPFMYLSLPLPSTVTRIMTVTVFYGDGSGLPMPYTVTVLKHGYCKDLSQALAAACCLKSDENLLLAEVYEQRIYRYIENPSELLTNIKDEEHIVAYRLPKKRAGLTRLEIIHRCQQQYVFFFKYIALSIEKENISSSSNIHSGKENGSVSEATDNPTNSCNTQSGSGNQSTDGTELEEMSRWELSFQLSITDERGLSCKPIEKDSLIRPGQFIRVMLDWTDKEHELYDASYLRDLPEVHKNGFTAKKTRPEAITLYCPNCKEHRQATKKLDLWRLPDILVFHLKRFSYSRYLKNKLDTLVNFPIHSLDLSQYVKCKDASSQSHVYELYAISNHYGGLGGGHYSAYAKLIDENRWYHFDDSHVSPVGESEIKTSAAYVLFYHELKQLQRLEQGSLLWVIQVLEGCVCSMQLHFEVLWL